MPRLPFSLIGKRRVLFVFGYIILIGIATAFILAFRGNAKRDFYIEKMGNLVEQIQAMSVSEQRISLYHGRTSPEAEALRAKRLALEDEFDTYKVLESDSAQQDLARGRAWMLFGSIVQVVGIGVINFTNIQNRNKQIAV